MIVNLSPFLAKELAGIGIDTIQPVDDVLPCPCVPFTHRLGSPLP